MCPTRCHHDTQCR
ncbi:hypothetical protein D046_5826B, partial [Vibrio parahaemolyticus V-223/04]